MARTNKHILNSTKHTEQQDVTDVTSTLTIFGVFLAYILFLNLYFISLK